MGILDLLHRKKQKAGLLLTPYGGGIRPAVIGPVQIQKMLGRLTLVRSTITAMILFLIIINGFYIYRLMSEMDTQLYVADGTPFGCQLEGL